MEETRKKKDRTSVKKVLGGFLALVLVAVISIVGTLAYLGRITDKAENTFKGSEDISVELTEPTWESTGETKAESYTPGLEIEKDPIITNTTSTSDTTGDYSEWVAMRVDYKVSDGTDLVAKTYSEFTNTTGVVSAFNGLNVYSTSATDKNWIKITPIGDAKFDIYVYKNKLDKGASTDALFTSVTINQAIEKVSGKYPEFKIDIFGAAIKNEKEFVDGADVALTELTIDNLKYGDATAKTTVDYTIMNELVKLLTKADTDSAEYTAFTGLNVDGTTP